MLHSQSHGAISAHGRASDGAPLSVADSPIVAVYVVHKLNGYIIFVAADQFRIQIVTAAILVSAVRHDQYHLFEGANAYHAIYERDRKLFTHVAHKRTLIAAESVQEIDHRVLPGRGIIARRQIDEYIAGIGVAQFIIFQCLHSYGIRDYLTVRARLWYESYHHRGQQYHK